MKRINLAFLAFTALSIAALTQFAPQALAAEDTIVAKAGTTVVTVDEVRRRLTLIVPDTAQRNELLGSPEKLRDIANNMLANKLAMIEAKNKKLDDTQEARDLLVISREEVMVQLLFKNVAPPSSIAEPTEQEIRDVYKNNKANLTVGKQYKVSQIFVLAAEDRTEDQKKEAKRKIDECYADLKGAKAEQFARSARICSENAATRDKGGDLGWLIEDQIAPQFKDVLVKMKPGDISAPIYAGGGWNILRLAEIKQAGMRTYEEVKDTIAQRIKEQKLQLARTTYIDKLMQDNKAEIKEDGIAALKP